MMIGLKNLGLLFFYLEKKYYICNVKFKSYKDMANKTSVISNTNAYGFARNVVAPTIVESLKSVSGISKVVYNKPTNIKDEIKLSFTEDSKKTYAVLAYTGEGDIKLSQYHMYNAKGNGIAFIKDGYAYFVELTTLQANWSNIMNGSYTYIDGIKMSATMTCADSNKVIELASKKIQIPNEVLDKFNNQKLEYI